jgi:hypothetical protein
MPHLSLDPLLSGLWNLLLIHNIHVLNILVYILKGLCGTSPNHSCLSGVQLKKVAYDCVIAYFESLQYFYRGNGSHNKDSVGRNSK